MNKFRKKNQIFTRNILNSKNESGSNEKSYDSVSEVQEAEPTHKQKLNEQIRV